MFSVGALREFYSESENWQKSRVDVLRFSVNENIWIVVPYKMQTSPPTRVKGRPPLSEWTSSKQR